ncbi:hypothetical protein SAMN05216359_10673 [Roseateles sp. YR242]|uniref:hypothetical protein n=1 Tax=Roseateles sp. YR242 TaxID=1855305 RepID=UPI0008BC2112|nr:hypothetical protein [Roseateles sp. YR242]SEL18758.1 hypothetical protein SAMN05216359_10673 [Roseateles sp. YR242]
MPNRLTNILGNFIPALRAHDAGHAHDAAPAGSSSIQGRGVGSHTADNASELLGKPLVFQQRMGQALDDMQEWPAAQGEKMQSLHKEVVLLLAATTRGHRIELGDVRGLERWLQNLEGARRAWQNMPCTRLREVDHLASIRTNDPVGDLALMEQLALARHEEAAARNAFGCGDWGKAELADGRAQLHCDVGKRVDQCMRAGTRDEKSRLVKLLDTCRKTGNFQSALTFRLAAEGAQPAASGLLRSLSDADSLLSDSEIEASCQRASKMEGRAFFDELFRLRKLIHAWPKEGVLALRTRQSLAVLSDQRLKDTERVGSELLYLLSQTRELIQGAARMLSAVDAFSGKLARLREILGSAPHELNQALAGRETHLRRMQQQCVYALTNGHLGEAESMLKAADALGDRILALLEKTASGAWQDASFQIDQRNSLSQTAQRWQERPLSVQQQQLLARFDLWQEHFDHAVDEREACEILYEMEELIQQVREMFSASRTPVAAALAPA